MTAFTLSRAGFYRERERKVRKVGKARDLTYHSPAIVNLFKRDRIEDNAGHHFREDGPVLYEPVVVGGGLLVDDAHYPL